MNIACSLKIVYAVIIREGCRKKNGNSFVFSQTGGEGGLYFKLALFNFAKTISIPSWYIYVFCRFCCFKQIEDGDKEEEDDEEEGVYGQDIGGRTLRCKRRMRMRNLNDLI